MAKTKLPKNILESCKGPVAEILYFWNVLYMRLDCWKHLRRLVCHLFSKVAPASFEKGV